MYNPYYQPQRPSDFIMVPNEETARNYPVAPGNSVNFKDENAAYIYTKTMGFSQFDRPIFKRYKLIEEEAADLPQISEQTNEPYKVIVEELKSKIGALESDIEGIKKMMEEKNDEPID